MNESLFFLLHAFTVGIEEANILPIISEDSGVSVEPSLSTSQLAEISSGER